MIDMLYYIKQSNIPITLTVVVDGLVQVVSVPFQEMLERCVRGTGRQSYLRDHFVHGTSTARRFSFTCTSLKQIDDVRYKTLHCNIGQRDNGRRRRKWNWRHTWQMLASSKQWLPRWRLQNLQYGNSKQRLQRPPFAVVETPQLEHPLPSSLVDTANIRVKLIRIYTFILLSYT